MKIDDKLIKEWKLAKKTKNIRAKPLISIMVDKSVTSKFLIDTLEGKEPLGDGVCICVGDAGDAWQQMPSKIIAKYDLIEVDKDGWMHFQPKTDNSTLCIELTQEFVDSFLDSDIHPNRQQDGTYYIIGLYGEKHDDGLRQYCAVGDFILKSRTDSTDVWVVNKKIFLNTYNIIS